MFTCLPESILVHEISPYLNKNDILNLNEVLPLRYRIIKKFSQDFIVNHHCKLLANKWNGIIKKINAQENSTTNYKRLHNIYKLFQDIVRPVNLIYLEYNTEFKLVLLERLHTFTLDTNMTPVYVLLKRLCVKCLEIIKN
jgi:hypothetical protein